MADAPVLGSGFCGFESHPAHFGPIAQRLELSAHLMLASWFECGMYDTGGQYA